MKTRLIRLFLSTFFLCCACFPAHAAEKIRIGVSTPTADHGWTGGVVWWAEQTVKELSAKHPDMEFIYRASDSDKEQAAHVETMLDKGIKALVILPHKPAPLTTVLNRLHKSGAFIVVVDRSIPKVPKDVYLAGDNYGFGLECGKFLAQALGGKGNIVVMEGIPCEGNSFRVNGFKDGVRDFPEVVVMDSQPAYWAPDKAYELMLEYLQQFPQIDAVWCGDDDVLESAVQAYMKSGRKDIRLFLGGGGSKRIIKRIIDGDPLVRATVTYPPQMIREGILIAVDRLLNGKEYGKEIVIPSALVTQENAKEHYFPDSIY